MKIKEQCSGEFQAVHHDGARSAAQIKNICLHSTEGPTARGAASWFANPNSQGSANAVVDDHTCYRTLPDLIIPWAAPGLNKQAWHLEFAGYAEWTTPDWVMHDTMIRRAAYKTALRCDLYNIPARYVGPAGLRLGRRGITTHATVTKAWPLLARKYGSHSDPGKGFPLNFFLRTTQTYLDEIRA